MLLSTGHCETMGLQRQPCLLPLATSVYVQGGTSARIQKNLPSVFWNKPLGEMSLSHQKMKSKCTHISDFLVGVPVARPERTGKNVGEKER